MAITVERSGGLHGALKVVDASQSSPSCGGESSIPDLTTITAFERGRVQSLVVPEPTDFILPGIRWGRFDTYFTPAFWRAQVWFEEIANANLDSCTSAAFALGSTIQEELAACLLGGYGIPAEVGLAAYVRVRDSGMLTVIPVSEDTLRRLLEEPLHINGRVVRYRFAAQRSRYLAASLAILSSVAPPSHARELRDWLLRLPGVGYKTASWITRNHTGSDKVAILDVHIHRAGLLLGIFSRQQRLACDYLKMESAFLSFAHAMGVSAALLDAIMWREMRWASENARRALGSGTFSVKASSYQDLEVRQLLVARE